MARSIPMPDCFPKWTFTDRQVASSCWGAANYLDDVPHHTDKEVMAAVAATRTPEMTQYEAMKAAMKVLGWVRPAK